MRSADRHAPPTWPVIGRRAIGGLIFAWLAGCADGLTPLSSAGAPQELAVTVARAGAVRLRWQPAGNQRGTVLAYVVERRSDLRGAFTEVARVRATVDGELQWLDTDVAPETIYGYRVIALTDLGDRSPPSTVAGVVTPPPPGIQVVTTAAAPVTSALDPDGYQVRIAGPDTVTAVLGTAATRRFSPLRPGRYVVALSGLVDRCSTPTPSQTVEVTDTVATTIIPVSFAVTCKDPARGELLVATTVTGDSLDDGWTVEVLGEAADTTLPPAQRVFAAQRSQTPGAPSTTFDNLRPGTYGVTIRGLAGNCTLAGGATPRTATVTPLGVSTVTFAATCVGSTPPAAPPSSAPFVWRNRWTPRAAAPGSTVTLESTLDLTARTGAVVRGVQATLRYDPAVLRFETEENGQLAQLIVNGSTPGVITFIASVPPSSAPRSGVVSLAKFQFTVRGAAGTRSPVTTSGLLATSTVPFQDSVRVVEDTMTVVAGTIANQPPTAQFTGPTAGTVGTAVTFNAAGSSDPDGSIASYAWTFGDNTAATGVSPTKTWSTAGTFTVTLTVTDNQGATATRSATVTIAGATPPIGATPVARANGPYTAQVGSAFTLSSTGSANATTFSWSLGDGRTVSGPSPSVTYATPGTYPIVLTVTGANGATNTAQTTATITAVTAPPAPPTPPAPQTPPTDGRPLVWTNTVQAFDPVNNSIAVQIVYNLGADVSETPGPEALRSFVVDSLRWDASRLQFLSLNYGPGIVDVATTQPGASSGRLVLRGATTPGLDGGTLVIATIRFRPIGPAGATTTTRTFLGPLIGTAATNSFSYNARTRVVEATITQP